MSFNKNNRSILDSELNSLNSWDNADGWNMADAFEADGFDADAFGADGYSEAAAVKHAHAKAARPVVSMPYIFTVVSTDAATQQVVLYGSEKNRTANNFGNPSTIAISYDFTGFYGGGTSGYGALLARTEAAPLTFGRIRLECTNTVQLSAPLNVSDYDPTGKQVTYPVVNFVKLNQFDQNAIETETDMTIYGGTQLQYNQLAGVTCRWFFYAADIASLKRGLGGKGVVKELSRPDTYIDQTIKLSAPKGLRIGG